MKVPVRSPTVERSFASPVASGSGRGPAAVVPRPLVAGVCHVVWGRLRDADPALAALLDGPEQRRLAALRRPDDRARFLVGCALLRSTLAAATGLPPASVPIDRGCPHCGEPHGKPALRGAGTTLPDVRFSVSHAGDRIVAAFALGARVGIDVEPLRPWARIEPVLAEALAPDELAALRAVDPAARSRAFATAWVRKEACLKALGLGLRIPLADVRVSPAADPPRLVAAPGRPDLPTATTVRDLQAGFGYAAALAVIGPCPIVEASAGAPWPVGRLISGEQFSDGGGLR